MAKLHQFLCTLPVKSVTMGQPSFVVVRYVLPVLPLFSSHGADGPELSTTLCLQKACQVVVPVEHQENEYLVELIRMWHPGGRCPYNWLHSLWL